MLFASTPRRGVPFCCAWSGGKDSCLALWRSLEAGAVPRALVTLFTEDPTRTRSHGLHRSVVDAQARALGLELLAAPTSWADDEESLVGLLAEARAAGIEAVVFGDMDVEAHGAWELRVARRAGLAGHLPLWGSRRRAILEAWWSLGFEARIVAVRDGLVPAGFLGRRLDAELASELAGLDVDVCGENGEFHTLAVGGPAFRRALPLRWDEVVRRADCWFRDVAVEDEHGSGAGSSASSSWPR